MSLSEPFGGDFKLDTKNMSSAAQTCEDLAQQMREVKQTLENAKTSLIPTWIGQGSNTFQKKFHVLMQQLQDINEELFDIAESIRNAEDSYIQTDMDAAKVINGVSSPLD